MENVLKSDLNPKKQSIVMDTLGTSLQAIKKESRAVIDKCNI